MVARNVHERPLPLLPLRSGMVLPGALVTLPVGRTRSRALVRAVDHDDLVLLAVQKDASVAEPTREDLHDIAVLAQVRQKTERSGGRAALLLVEGIERVRLLELVTEQPYLRARTELVPEIGADSDTTEALADSLRKQLLDAPELGDASLRRMLEQTRDPSRLADRIVSSIEAPAELRVAALLELDVEARLRLAMDMIAKARAAAAMREKIDSEVRKELGKNQREAVLRQQLQAIKKELGDKSDDLDPLREKLDSLDLPEDVREQVDREMDRLEAMGSNSPDANLTRRYLEFVSELPWSDRAPASDDLAAVEHVLEDEHEGLEEPKKRILEHMAVLKLGGLSRGTILCLVGPPGVGKTSLAQSVASATNRPLQRIALGGVRDEAEIRGHRRTYIGALPGRILAALRKAKVKNPVLVLDEIDKLGRGWQGDPEAALLEVLDPEQNHAFTDHYLELPFDLSEVLFIATANDISQLSPPLRDRLEVIDISGYTTQEKVQIASKHLVPKQLEKHGLPEGALDLDGATIEAVVRDYTREAGVRQLAREIAKLCRAVALDWARKLPADTKEPAPPEPVTIREGDLKDKLGRPRFFAEMNERVRPPGVAAGLAWTPVGGDVLYVETTRMNGKGKLEITGQLGDVMNESARAALAYLRSHADELGIAADFLDRTDLHIHVPAGAVPKDGPSAGVTLFTALASLLTGRRVRPDTAMTGEATLRGRVLPVGGIKSKVLAAHRAGFTRVLLPKRNEHHLDEIPASVLDELEIVLVTDMQEVFREALDDEPTVLDPSPKDGEDGRVSAA